MTWEELIQLTLAIQSAISEGAVEPDDFVSVEVDPKNGTCVFVGGFDKDEGFMVLDHLL